MRIEISYKFIAGFLLVVASVVLMGMLVPLLGVQEEFQQLVTIASAIVIGLTLGIAFSRAFTANIQEVNEGAYRLSRGDLTANITLRKPLFADETVDLAVALNAVAHGLRELVTHIRGASESVAVSASGLSFTALEMNTSSLKVADTVEQIAFGVDLQTDMVEKASLLIREVSLLAELVAASAKKLTIAAVKTTETAQHGGERVDQTTQALRKILKETEIVAERMGSHSAQLQRIDTFIEVIVDIANESNFLAQSARNEAERIGGNDQGLSVLAENIRKLAESANGSAVDIAELIGIIFDENQAILASMTETMERINEGRLALDVTGLAFGEIVEDAAVTREKAISIAELSERQTAGVKEIVLAIDEISKVTSENAQATRETAEATNRQTMAMTDMAHAANYLNTLAEDLTRTVQRFRLEAD